MISFYLLTSVFFLETQPCLWYSSLLNTLPFNWLDDPTFFSVGGSWKLGQPSVDKSWPFIFFIRKSVSLHKV